MQDQTPDALILYSQEQSQQIDGHYVEGISLTHGSTSTPGHLQQLSMRRAQ